MKKELVISISGINTRNPRGLVIDRPAGLGEYLVMCFTTPFLILTSSGREEGLPGDCIINTPKFPNWHTALPQATGGFINDFIHASGKLVPALIKRYKLPVNTLMRTGETSLMTYHLHNIQMEESIKEPFWENNVSLHFEMIFADMARKKMLFLRDDILTSFDKERKTAFLKLRVQMHNSLKKEWDVEMMSKTVCLSPNRFSVLYRKFFKISPMEDLISKRIDHAKWLLSSSDMTIDAIAAECGFSNLFYFSRVFNSKVGLPPGRFRKTSRKSEWP